MDLLERRAERAAHLQELQSAAREAYLKEVRADIAQNIKLTQVTWVGAWQVLMFFFLGGALIRHDHKDPQSFIRVIPTSQLGALVQRMTIGMMMLMMISLDSLGMGLPGRGNSSGEENEAIECQVCCRGACDAR